MLTQVQADHADRSVSTYATVKAKDGVVFSRVYWSFSMNVGTPVSSVVCSRAYYRLSPLTQPSSLPVRPTS